MKYFAFYLISLISLTLQAQVKLKPGTKISSHVTAQSESDLGSGMLMNTEAETEYILTVDNEKKNVYELTNKLMGLKLKMTMMGQETAYDSKNENDKTSESGKMISPLIGSEVKFMVNKTDGKVFPVVPSDSAKNSTVSPLPGLDDLNGVKLVETMFLVISEEEKKAGKWTRSDSANGNVSNTVYTITSLKDNEAMISYILTGTSVNESEAMEMTVKTNMKISGKGEIICDLKTMLVKKHTVSIETTGNMEVAGQSTDVTGKSNATSIFSIQ